MHSTYRYRPRKRSVFAFPIPLACLIGLQLGGCGTDAENVGSDQQPIGNPDPAITNPSAPHVVAIEDADGDAFCTGTVLDDGTLLTAAHCLLGRETSIIELQEFSIVTPMDFRIRDTAQNLAGDYLIGGDQAIVGIREGFVAAVLGPEHDKIEFLQLPGTPFGSNVTSVGVTKDFAFAAGTRTEAGGSTTPFLLGFERIVLTPGSPSEDTVFRPWFVLSGHLGAGTPLALVSHDNGENTTVAVAMRRTDEGRSFTRVVELALEKTATTPRLSSTRTVIAELADAVPSSIVRLDDGRIALGSVRLSAPVGLEVRLAQRTGESWSVGTAIRVPGTHTRGIRLAVLDDKLAILALDLRSPELYLRDISSGLMSENLFSQALLAGHYIFAEATREGNPLVFDPTSITATKPSGSPATDEQSLFVSGNVRIDGERRNVIVKLKEDSSVDRTFGINGVVVRKDSNSHLGGVEATQSKTYVAHWSQSNDELTVSESNGSGFEDLLAASSTLSAAHYGDGLDLALVELSPTPPGGIALATHAPAPGQVLECLGIGASPTSQLTQGTFSIVTADSSSIIAVGQPNAFFADGDSGGPCFAQDGALIGVIVSATDDGAENELAPVNQAVLLQLSAAMN